MKIAILWCALALLLPGLAQAALIEEAGLSNVECRVSRTDQGTGEVINSIVCTFDSVDESGFVVRRDATTGLDDLTPAQGAQILQCVDIAWTSVYSQNGFPVPTPRPTPIPLEDLVDALQTPNPETTP